MTSSAFDARIDVPGALVHADEGVRVGPFGRGSRAAEQQAEVAEERSSVNAAELLPILYRQLYSLAGPRPDLDDLVQIAAERALRAIDRFSGQAQLSTWTYRIAYCTFIDHTRWYRRFSRRFFSSEDLDDPPHPSPYSDALLIERQRAARLYAALDQLPPKKRAVIVLHDLEGLTGPEVATIMEVSEGTIRSRLRDGRLQLAALLRDDPLFSETAQATERVSGICAKIPEGDA
jgi:RNA polymerase sigma-70 factor (ECF subfamily)